MFSLKSLQNLFPRLSLIQIKNSSSTLVGFVEKTLYLKLLPRHITIVYQELTRKENNYSYLCNVLSRFVNRVNAGMMSYNNLHFVITLQSVCVAYYVHALIGISNLDSSVHLNFLSCLSNVSKYLVSFLTYS